MIKPTKMYAWKYDEGKKETVKTLTGYLPCDYDDRGFLVGVSAPLFAWSLPVATEEEAMKMLELPPVDPSAMPYSTMSSYL